jgi:hypothetical protein
MNYGRDTTGKDSYSHFGSGTAYTYAPGYGKTYGTLQAAPQHHPTAYGKLLANAYSQPAPQTYQQPQHYHTAQAKSLGYGQTQAAQLQLQAHNTGYGQRVQHH